MKALNTVVGEFGPFNLIEVLADRYRCDGIDYPLAVVGVVTIDEYVAPPPTQDEIDAKRLAVIAASDAKAKAVRDQITSNIAAAEMASWPIKRTEALAHQAKGIAAVYADAPLLTLEATARGITTAALVAKVLTKATMLSELEAAVAGRNGAINDAAAAAITVAELAAIDIEAGWPV